MKKIISSFFIAIMLCIFSLSYSNAKTIPLYKNSINIEGIGIIKLPQTFTIYEEPNTNSTVLKQYKWGDAQGAIYSEDYNSDFIIFHPAHNIGYMTVVDDIEGENWYKVCYDQKKQLTGWVSPNNYNFFNWLSFFTKYGKANGLYAFRDLDLTEKRLYSKDDLNSQIISTFKNAKNIQVLIFRGNWVLVRVYDFEGGLKIGWLKWRTDEGKFKFFPNVIE